MTQKRLSQSRVKIIKEDFRRKSEKSLKGRAKKAAKTAKMGADELEALILDSSGAKSKSF